MKRQLNLKNGLLSSYYTLQLDDGKKIAIQTKKIANMENVHQYAVSYSFTPLNFSEEVTFISEADGDVYNYNVERYRSLSSRHLQVSKLQADKEMVSLLAKTNTSNITVSQQAKLRSFQHSLDDLVIEEQSDKVMQKVPLRLKNKILIPLKKPCWLINIEKKIK